MRRKFKKGVGNHAKSGRSWCGPYAMTVLTGWDYEKCEEAIRKVRDDTGRLVFGGSRGTRFESDSRDPFGRSRPVKGTFAHEIARALGSLGFSMGGFISCRDMSKRGVSACPTFAKWTKTRGPLINEWLLVNVTGHWVVVKGKKVWDATTEAAGSFLSKFGNRRIRVNGYYVIRAGAPTKALPVGA